MRCMRLHPSPAGQAWVAQGELLQSSVDIRHKGAYARPVELPRIGKQLAAEVNSLDNIADKPDGNKRLRHSVQRLAGAN